MPISPERKKYNVINKYNNAFDSKAYYTKVNQYNQRVNASIMMHQGYYNVEVASAATVANGGNGNPRENNILVIGFGLGYSAQKFIEMGVRSYTCIEINDQLYANALSWAENDYGIPITIYNGDWQDIMPLLGRGFHGIYYSMYDEIGDEKNLEQFMKASSNACFEGAICSIQGLPLFSNFDPRPYSTGEIPEAPSSFSFDSFFTYSFYSALVNIGYWNVYTQYWNGGEWLPNYKEGGGGIIFPGEIIG